MKDPSSVMPPDTAVMFTLLQASKFLNDFVLIGGTALALHIGHRRSEDLDFITPHLRLPRQVLTDVEEIIRKKGHSIAYVYDQGSLDDFENAGTSRCF